MLTKQSLGETHLFETDRTFDRDRDVSCANVDFVAFEFSE